MKSGFVKSPVSYMLLTTNRELCDVPLLGLTRVFKTDAVEELTNTPVIAILCRQGEEISASLAFDAYIFANGVSPSESVNYASRCIILPKNAFGGAEKQTLRPTYR